MAAAAWHTTENFQDVWTLETLLGKGVFGQIYEVREKASRRVEAVKVLTTKTQKMRESAQHEANIWRWIGQHQNIVKLHEIYQERDNLFLVMEKCDCHILKRLSYGYRMRETPPFFRQMLTSIAHLHMLNIVHRDIKLDNFLCVGQGSNTVKLCDFGFATTLPLGGNLTDTVGTPPYMSPEMLTLRSYNAKTDVWSAGVGFYFLFSGGRFPYQPEERNSLGMKKAITQGAQLTSDFHASKHVTSTAKEFVVTLMNRNATNRLTAETALQHPFLQASHSGTVSKSEHEHSGCILSECEDVAEDVAMPAVRAMPKRQLAATAPRGLSKEMPLTPAVIFEI